MELIPPDYEQCQAIITDGHNAFRIGPPPVPRRCTEKPVLLAVELVAGEDGKTGSMTLCLECSFALLKDPVLSKRTMLVKFDEENVVPAAKAGDNDPINERME